MTKYCLLNFLCSGHKTEQNHFVGSVIILASTTQSTADIMVQVHLPARGEEKKKQLRTL